MTRKARRSRDGSWEVVTLENGKVVSISCGYDRAEAEEIANQGN